MLGVLSVGLFAYGAWRVVAAALGGQHGEEVTGWKRLGWVAAAAVYFALFAQAIGIIVGSGGNGPSNNPRPYVASVLGWAGGPVWIGLSGFLAAGAGCALTIWGVAHDYRQELTVRAPARAMLVAARISGAFGNATRGFLVALLAAYLFSAAVTDDAAKVKSLDAALETVAHQPYGSVLLSVVASGLLAFGLFSFIEARHRRL